MLKWHHNQFFFDVVLFLLSNLVTDQSFMWISSMVLKLWQLSVIRDWPEIGKSDIPTSEFFPISGDWGKLGTPNLAAMSLLKCWMLRNARVASFTVLEPLRKSQQGEVVKLITPPLPRLRSKKTCKAEIQKSKGK